MAGGSEKYSFLVGRKNKTKIELLSLVKML
jgi:hypothetical protein